MFLSQNSEQVQNGTGQRERYWQMNKWNIELKLSAITVVDRCATSIT
jgi:hypothetical protein